MYGVLKIVGAERLSELLDAREYNAALSEQLQAIQVWDLFLQVAVPALFFTAKEPSVNSTLWQSRSGFRSQLCC